jgi:NUMOD4 motif-containing protein/HNH endonuclease
MEVENWRPIAGYPGYQVSDLGRVRSVDRIIIRMTKRGPVQVRLAGRVLRQGRARNGYLTVSLSGRSVNVHTLVLRAFRGEPLPGHQGAHDNGDPRDNRAKNLLWKTRRANEADKLRHGTYLAGSRTHNGRKTACKSGHPFDDRNTRRNRGWRACRACQRERDRKRLYRQARRDEMARRSGTHR